MVLIIALIVGYLIGSIPFAVLIAKSRGINIFKVGSGNPGATNVKRSVGKMEGNACFVLDAFKGFAPVMVMAMWGQWAAVVALLGALLGHSFSIWIGFRGGKGVATTVGGLLAFMPIVMIGGLIIWITVFSVSRYVSLASIAMALWLPIGVVLTDTGILQAFLALFNTDTLAKFIVALAIAVIIVLRHRSNIDRLRAGTENKFEKKKKGE